MKWADVYQMGVVANNALHFVNPNAPTMKVYSTGNSRYRLGRETKAGGRVDVSPSLSAADLSRWIDAFIAGLDWAVKETK